MLSLFFTRSLGHFLRISKVGFRKWKIITQVKTFFFQTKIRFFNNDETFSSFQWWSSGLKWAYETRKSAKCQQNVDELVIASVIHEICPCSIVAHVNTLKIGGKLFSCLETRIYKIFDIFFWGSRVMWLEIYLIVSNDGTSSPQALKSQIFVQLSRKLKHEIWNDEYNIRYNSRRRSHSRAQAASQLENNPTWLEIKSCC